MRFVKILAAGLILVAGIVICHHVLFVERTPWPCAIVVHESASTFGDVDLIRKWHLQRGWDDIGYHAVILNGKLTAHSAYNPRLDGKIEPGHSELSPGHHCHADNMNAYALGVCLVGEPGKRGYPTRHQIDALVHYCAVECRRYAIPVPMITQHSDHEPLKPLCASLDMNDVRRRIERELRKDPSGTMSTVPSLKCPASSPIPGPPRPSYPLVRQSAITGILSSFQVWSK